MPAERIAEIYMQRADIERAFRALKSELRIAPVFLRLPHRIRAHALICFLALLLNRVMRSRLNKNGGLQSPAEAVRILNLLKRIEINVKGEKVSALTKLQEEQLELFDLLEVDRPEKL